MDKNQKLQFWSMVLIGYTGGSLLLMLITYFIGAEKLELSYIRMYHIYLFCLLTSISWIWVKLHRHGMPAKDVWKVRCLMIGVMITEFLLSQILYRFLYEGSIGVMETLPKIIIIGCGGIVFAMIIWYFVFDSVEKSCLKRINEKLSQNKPQ